VGDAETPQRGAASVSSTVHISRGCWTDIDWLKTPIGGLKGKVEKPGRTPLASECDQMPIAEMDLHGWPRRAFAYKIAKEVLKKIRAFAVMEEGPFQPPPEGTYSSSDC